MIYYCDIYIYIFFLKKDDVFFLRIVAARSSSPSIANLQNAGIQGEKGTKDQESCSW